MFIYNYVLPKLCKPMKQNYIVENPMQKKSLSKEIGVLLIAGLVASLVPISFFLLGYYVPMFALLKDACFAISFATGIVLIVFLNCLIRYLRKG